MNDASPSVTQETPALKEGFGDLARQFWDFVRTLWASGGRHVLTLLSVGTILVICLTAVAQVGLNAWNRPFYDAIEQRNFKEFLYQLMVFFLIAGALLVLNVAQAWLREMIKVKSREWLTKDLFAQWLEPGRTVRLSYAGEIGVNPDQRIHEDARHLTELSADLGIGLFQATLLLGSFLGVLWSLSGSLVIPIGERIVTIPGYMVWCALAYAATGSWLTWWIGRSLVGMNTRRYQRESELRFALVQANQQAESIAQHRGEQAERERLNIDLSNVLVVMREIVGATARLTWVTAGYGWIALVAPIVIASPVYFIGKLSFGELMMVVGGFYQVNNSLRWFVDNFALLADWRATLLRVMNFRETLLTFESDLNAKPQIDYAEHPEGKLEFDNLGVEGSAETASLDSGKVEVGPGDRVLVLDKTRNERTPLLPALAQKWPWGSGKLKFPGDARVAFLCLHPYFPKGSIRAALAYPADAATVSDPEAAAALERVGLGRLSRSLDRTARWWQKLDDEDQARLALARLLVQRPKWIFTEGLVGTISSVIRELAISILDNELVDAALISISRRPEQGPLARRIIELTGAPAAPAERANS
ncbi:MAG: ABC transporter ATP-binding protein/permease [Hyphomicrobiales bacterium]